MYMNLNVCTYTYNHPGVSMCVSAPLLLRAHPGLCLLLSPGHRKDVHSLVCAHRRGGSGFPLYT